MRLIILGAGGHGKVVADLAEQTGKYDAVYFLDDVSNDSRVIGICSDFEKFNTPDTGKRKIASTLTFLGGCFAATDI